MIQMDSLFTALDSLRLPAVLIAFGAWVFFEFRALTKKVHDMNLAKEDKSSVEVLKQDFKGLSMRHNDAVKAIDARHVEAQKKADQRARVHELTIVALAPADQKHDVIADLKGD